LSLPSLYLDLESPLDRDKLNEPVSYLSSQEDKLVILDEVQRMRELFTALRGIIDAGRRQDKGVGRFLLLGSASADLLKQSETLAGRIAYLELSAFNVLEIPEDQHSVLWVRGGFPSSFLASDERHSIIWREDFIRTYLERDIPDAGSAHPRHHAKALLDHAGACAGLSFQRRHAGTRPGCGWQNHCALSGPSHRSDAGTPSAAVSRQRG
jgi:hypothetical protein